MTSETHIRISNASIIAAAMVVGIHVCDCHEVGSLLWWWEELTHYGVFLIAVPFFFTCSGYFLARHYIGCEGSVLGATWCREVRKRLRSLFVPYVLWSAIAAAVPFGLILGANLRRGRELVSNMPSLGWYDLVCIFGLHPFDWPSLIPLWYVRALLIFVGLSPIAYLAIRRWGGWICSLIFAAVGGIALFGESMGVWAIFFRKTFSLTGLLYFSIGMWLRVQEEELKQGHGMEILRRCRYWLLIGGLALVVLSAFGHYAGGSRLQIARVLFVPPLLLAFWSFLPTKPFPVWLTSSAFPIFLIHIIFLRLPWPAVCYHWPVRWVIGFVGALLLTLILRHVFPRMASLLFGGR